MLRICLSFVTLLFLGVPQVTNAEKSIKTQGILKCGAYPAAKVLVRLWSVDEGSIDLLEQTHSNETGHFNLVGRSSSDNDWRPVLTVHHDCADIENVGRRKMNFLIPKRYVTKTETPETIFDLGTWNLETFVTEDEERVEKITKRKRDNGSKHKAEAHHRNDTLDRYENPDERIDPW